MLQAAEKTQEQPPKKASCLFSDLRVDPQVEEKSQKDCRVNVLAALSGDILGGHGKIHSATGVLYAPIHDTLESIAEAPVSFHISDPVSEIPAPILHRCLRGNHVPLVPHAQRLLVASHKEAKVEDVHPKRRVSGKTKAAKKVESKEVPDAAEPESANVDGADAEPEKQPRKRVLTAYGVARADYINAQLGFMSWQSISLGSKLLASPRARSESRCGDALPCLFLGRFPTTVRWKCVGTGRHVSARVGTCRHVPARVGTHGFVACVSA